MDTYGRVNDDVWAKWIGKSIDAQVDFSIATRFTDMDFTHAVQQRFNEVARALLNINAATAREARD